MSAKTRKRRRAPTFTPGTETASVEVLIRRVDKLQRQNGSLEAKLEASKPTDQLLTRIAAALQLAKLATDPRQSTPTDGDGRHSPNIPSPGDNVRGALRAERALRQRIGRALIDYDRAAEHMWYPPRPSKSPQMRCRNPGCSARDKRIPKYVGPRGTKIELIRCPKCDKELADDQ